MALNQIGRRHVSPEDFMDLIEAQHVANCGEAEKFFESLCYCDKAPTREGP